MTLHDAEIVLLEFATEKRHDAQTLDRYLRRHPELASELVDVAHELRLAEALGPSDARQDDAQADAAWSRYNAVRAPVLTDNTGDPFAPFKGEGFARLATTMATKRSFLTPLRDRQVEVSSIPAGFLERLSKALGASIADLLAFLALPARRPAALSFKADGKPATDGKISFAALVASSSLTPEELAVLERDGI